MAIPILRDTPRRGDLVGGAIMLVGVLWLLRRGRDAESDAVAK